MSYLIAVCVVIHVKKIMCFNTSTDTMVKDELSSRLLNELLHLKTKVLPASVTLQAGLCQTWSETQIAGFVT